MKPYMVKRCEMRRFGLLNSPEVSTSLATVFKASALFSPALSVRVAFFWACLEFSKKYRALFLWSMSSIVPATTRTTISTT
jgi:hypothetical protein